ncbi:calcium-binding protein [Actinoplanes sp. NPDC024001]|uniref:calcium-binding protein n=1 Tax=Actinoplanes sp. NPDC024001 TaxID=3154598 RepID=UPI0033E21EBB
MTRLVWPARVAVGLLATAGMGLIATPAQAASTGVARVKDGSAIHYAAGNNATNKVVVTRSGRVVTIDDRVPIRAGAGCAAAKNDRTKVRCTLKDTALWDKTLVVSLGNRSDSLVNRTAVSSLVRGGSGSDSLTGGSRNDELHGESGKDRLVGRSGNDQLYGGTNADRLTGGGGVDSVNGNSGNDVLYGNSGNDLLNGGSGDDQQYAGTGNDQFWTWGPGTDGSDLMSGGSGRDSVKYVARTLPIVVDLDGAKGDDGAKGERDSVGADIEDLFGGSGDDVLVGNGSANRLDGVLGNDRLYGGDGSDDLYGHAGNDFLSGEDPTGDVPDRLDGNEDTDVCKAFAGDVKVNCEA